MATNYVTASYNEVYDLGTRDGKMTVIGVHTPTGAKPRQMLKGFFSQFRKFCYKGCSLRMVPCATLPADPLGVGYEAGELQVDPREMVNPILFKGAHGESLNMVLDQIYKNSGFTFNGTSLDGQEDNFTYAITNSERAYYAGLSDPTFKKFGIQSGVSLKGLHPLAHKVALTRALVPNAQHADTGSVVSSTGIISWTGDTVSSGANPGLDLVPATQQQFFTNGVTRLGWLPTRTFFKSGPIVEGINATYLPKLYMGVLILPPSYKIEQYFRLIITHYFAFKDFSTALAGDDYNTYTVDYYDEIDEPSDSAKAKTLTFDEILEQMPDIPTVDGNADIQLVTSGVN